MIGRSHTERAEFHLSLDTGSPIAGALLSPIICRIALRHFSHTIDMAESKTHADKIFFTSYSQ